MNRWMLGYQYPLVPQLSGDKKNKHGSIVEPLQRTRISEQELEQALGDMDRFMDVTPGDLSNLLTDVQMHRFQRYRGNITCADIMVRDVPAVEYGTEVEDAWQIMHREKLKAMPVIDNARRVIGIVAWSDFFKFVNLNVYETFQDKFRAFIRRTPDVTTTKPEAVGQLMTASVMVLQENTHIAELIPLMSNEGHRQIPIVNHENRLVGMVYQANLIAALYNESCNHLQNQ
ncbi:MAG: CBS domain-containing protein [Methylococcaceae bacterium]